MSSNAIYCVYLTTYHGDKLPPYYIGSTSLHRIQRGYRGSVVSRRFKKLWREELQNHPELFSIEILSTWETREAAYQAELQEQINRNVVKSSQYVNVRLATASGGFGACGEKHPFAGDTKDTNPILSQISQSLSGRTAETHSYIAEASKKKSKTTKGRKADDYPYINKASEKRAKTMTGRTKETHQGVARAAQKISEVLTGRTAETHQYIADLAEKQQRLSKALRLEFVSRKDNGESMANLHSWIKSLGIKIAKSSLWGIYYREKRNVS